MPDMLAFLAGLRVDSDTITLDGEPVCYVLGHTGRQVSTVEAAEWIITAAHAYAELLRAPMTAMKYLQRQGYHDVDRYYNYREEAADAER